MSSFRNRCVYVQVFRDEFCACEYIYRIGFYLGVFDFVQQRERETFGPVYEGQF